MIYLKKKVKFLKTCKIEYIFSTMPVNKKWLIFDKKKNENVVFKFHFINDIVNDQIKIMK